MSSSPTPTKLNTSIVGYPGSNNNNNNNNKKKKRIDVDLSVDQRTSLCATFAALVRVREVENCCTAKTRGATWSDSVSHHWQYH